MTHAPGVPQEQASFADKGARTVEDGVKDDRPDEKTGPPSGQPGDAVVDLDARRTFGDLKQNLTNQWKVRESTAIRPD